MRVADRTIGPGHPVFIIAEAGVNHNGDLALARQLVDAALEAGADAVKFQTWITEELVAPSAALAAYQQENVGAEQTQFEVLKALELAHESFRDLKAHAERAGILFFSTPDEEKSADFLHRLGMPVFKIGSAEIDNLPFLTHVARFGQPIILSTGMATLEEVERAVGTIRAAGNEQLALLHCVSDYPASPADCNLRAMATMAEAFGCPVGFSDHTLGQNVALAAVATGACVIEKHLTLDRQMEGLDHRASLDPQQFRAFVDAIREVESAMGNGLKNPTAAEIRTRECVRKRLVASRDLRAGEVLAENDVQLRRSSTGVPFGELSRLLNRRLKTGLARGTAFELTMFD
jgi:N-acetylneuraminate synthase